mgnify:CR=1 FL=1
MKQFHPLTIERIERETTDSVRIALAVPPEFEAEYEFLPGQHLPFEIVIDGKKLRPIGLVSAREVWIEFDMG